MTNGDKVKHTIREAVTYRCQGLVSEARIKFEEARKLVMSDLRIRNSASVIARIDREISALNGEGCHRGEMITFDQLPLDTRTRIRQISEHLESRPEGLPSFAGSTDAPRMVPADIITIEVTIETASGKSSHFALDVTIQDEDRVSSIIPKKDSSLVAMISVGTRIETVRYLTPNAIVEGTGLVISCSEIKHGPKRGDHGLTLQIYG
jgi:hypothetical protein